MCAKKAFQAEDVVQSTDCTSGLASNILAEVKAWVWGIQVSNRFGTREHFNLRLHSQFCASLLIPGTVD